MLYGYLFKPLEQNPLLLSTFHNVFDVKFKHLDYFPIVNQRVFSIGEEEDDLSGT